MTNLDSVLKSRDTTLPTNVCRVKTMVFPVVMHGCESWTISQAECQRIDALWCWRRLKGPLDCKEIKPVNSKGNQPWIFTGRTDAKAEAPIILPPDTKSQLIGKDSELGKIEGRRKTGQQRMRWLNGITHSVDMSWANSERWWTGKPGVLQFIVLPRAEHDLATKKQLRCCLRGSESLTFPPNKMTLYFLVVTNFLVNRLLHINFVYSSLLDSPISNLSSEFIIISSR